MLKINKKISTLTLLKMVIKSKKISEINNFLINNNLLKIADIFLQDFYNAKVNICHCYKRLIVNLINKKNEVKLIVDAVTL